MEKLRPTKQNGDAIALAALALGVTVFVTWLRLEGPWASAVNFFYTLVAAVVVLGLAYLSPAGRGRPPTYQSALFVIGVLLAALALINLKDVLGSSSVGPPGSRVWILLVLVAITAYLSWFRRSGVMTLFAGLFSIALVLSLVEWLFTPARPLETNRWVLAILVFALIGVVALLDVIPAKYRQVAVVDAAGFGLLALSLTFLGGGGLLDLLNSSGASAGWEIVIGLGSLLLIGYAMLEGDPGPGYLGGLNLIAFSVIAATTDPSFVWWPLILFIITIALFAAAFTGQRIPAISDVQLQVTRVAKKPAAKKKAVAKKTAAAKA